MKKNVLLVIAMVVLASCTKKEDYLIISVEDYRDKMQAAWIGQMAGVAWGIPTEFKFNGQIIPVENTPEWESDYINRSIEQDDIYVELTFVRTLEERGIDCDILQAGVDFANSEYLLWGANRVGRSNLQLGIAPPASSHPKYNMGADWIDYQIEADYSGIIAPGMPNVSVELGEKFGRLMNYGDGLYGGQLVGAMYAHAFFETDVKTIIEESLESIPEESQYAECVRDVITWYEEDTINWQKTWQKIEDKYYLNPRYQKYKQVSPEYWVDMDAKLNGAYIILGLLYGHGDMDSTIIISMRAGRDSDCNPSNAAGILATTLGMKKLDTKYYEAIDTVSNFSYTSYNVPALFRVSENLAREYVQARGGKTETDKSGNAFFYIPREEIKKSSYVQSWDPKPVSVDTAYNATYFDQIKYLSYKEFEDLLEEQNMGTFTLDFASKGSSTEFIQWMGKDKVIKTVSSNTGRSVLYFDGTSISEDNSVLSFKVSHNPDEKWNLYITTEWNRVKVDEIIEKSTCPNGWKEVKLDLKEYIGQTVNIQINQKDVDEKLSTAYWTDFNWGNN
ncbi:MAG: ADP-ribosylglycohydrolase family protein [Bacteroidota bacterium]